MAKKEFKTDISNFLGETPKNKKSQDKKRGPGRPKDPNKRTPENSSQLGTRNGETRATFVIKEETLEKIKAIAKKEGFYISDVAKEAFNRFIRDYEKAKGTIDKGIINKKSIL